MALSITHSFTSAIADDPVAQAAGEVLPSHWNAVHSFSGTLDVANGGTGATSSADARTALGLGTAATAASTDFAAASHTHTASQVTDFSEAVDDRVAALLVAGTNITLTYNDAANSLTIDASGGTGITLAQARAVVSLRL